jgi:hypothetical protein
MNPAWQSRFERIARPTTVLWACWLAAWLAGFGYLGQHSVYVLMVYALPLVLSSWVMADMRRRGEAPCYDYSTWVFLNWPVVLPVYLFQTRGKKAWLTIGAFFGMGFVTGLIASLLFALK